MSVKYSDVSSATIVELSSMVDILVVTATNVETETLHDRLVPLPGRPGLIRIFHGSQTYIVGTLGKYAIAHVQCGMGSVGREAAITTGIDSIDTWKPKAVIMVGIAFGVDNEKQKIGDVLISECILPYDNKREGKDKTIFRSPHPPSGQILLNRFKNPVGWAYETPAGTASYTVAPMLSGETLVDNKEYRDKLCAQFPSAKGGEMEGVGLVSAAETRKREWILVKGICDFADGEKATNKLQYQKTAASSAVSLCEFVFSHEFIFEALEITPVTQVVRRVSS